LAGYRQHILYIYECLVLSYRYKSITILYVSSYYKQILQAPESEDGPKKADGQCKHNHGYGKGYKYFTLGFFLKGYFTKLLHWQEIIRF